MKKEPEATPADDNDPDDRPAPVPTMDEVLRACDTIRAYLQNRPNSGDFLVIFNKVCDLVSRDNLAVIHPTSLVLQTFLC